MPKIIVQAEETGEVTLDERIVSAHLESPHYAGQLIERLAWATTDAEGIEARRQPPPGSEAETKLARSQPGVGPRRPASASRRRLAAASIPARTSSMTRS